MERYILKQSVPAAECERGAEHRYTRNERKKKKRKKERMSRATRKKERGGNVQRADGIYIALLDDTPPDRPPIRSLLWYPIQSKIGSISSILSPQLSFFH